MYFKSLCLTKIYVPFKTITVQFVISFMSNVYFNWMKQCISMITAPSLIHETGRFIPSDDGVGIFSGVFRCMNLVP